MKIGITERGDAGWDLSWSDILRNDDEYAGAIIITKSANRPDFITTLLNTYPIKPIILHADCTGWGNTPMEPYVADPETVLRNVRHIINSGFPADHTVLRIDPIIPSPEGINRAKNVLLMAQDIIPDVQRIRISIYDDYHKAREEMIRRGYKPIDSIRKWKNESERRPTNEHVKSIADMLLQTRPNTLFECCAEPELVAYNPHFIPTGCCSFRDLDIMGIDTTSIKNEINKQNRFGCLCLHVKSEMLTHKRRCPNNCAYCYWGQ